MSRGGIVKRSEVYCDNFFIIGKDKFAVRMESYGHFKRSKIVMGVNQLAYAFDVLLFDYVYLFLEREQEAMENIKKLIKSHIDNCRFRDALKLISALEKLFLYERYDLYEYKITCFLG